MKTNKMQLTVIFIIGLIIGYILTPMVVNASQRVFDRTMIVSESGFGHDRVERYDDPNFQVKCWIIDGIKEGGITCLPWSEVKPR